MNDFTKAELQYLFRTFTLTNGGDFEHKLEDKIQSMIDNYCDSQDICGGNHMYVMNKCASCGKIYE
jgi:hypothetical protein